MRARQNDLLGVPQASYGMIPAEIASMPSHWKKRLQDLIDLTNDRIRRLEAGETLRMAVGVHSADATRQTIENERAIVVRLQQTIEALNAAVQNRHSSTG